MLRGCFGQIRLDSWSYCTMEQELSQVAEAGNQERMPNRAERRAAAKGKGKSSGAGRTRVFAIVVYPDSAPDDWKERLTQEHVSVLISPLHDQDVNPDGSQKKPHYHVMVMFDGVKSQEQVDAMWDRVLGENRVKHYETVNSTRGYGRYLCHLDNPEKAQYDKADVVGLGGADYEEIISLPSDDWEVLDKIYDYLEEHSEEEHAQYYSKFMQWCRRERRDWWKLLMRRYTYAIVQYMKSDRIARADMRMRAEQEGWRGRMPRMRVDTATGEVIGEGGSVGYDGQD